MRIKKGARDQKSEGATNTKAKFTDNSADAQRNRLLDALKKGPVTTIEARRDLDIMMPAARIYELRHNDGYSINMIWVDRQTTAGNTHRVALYVLQSHTPAPRPLTPDLFDPAMEMA